MPTASIVGYTNAGKTSLLNILTGADALVEDKLFATLDTTTRKLPFANGTELLLTDTVGFIRKLPPHLVAQPRPVREPHAGQAVEGPEGSVETQPLVEHPVVPQLPRADHSMALCAQIRYVCP